MCLWKFSALWTKALRALCAVSRFEQQRDGDAHCGPVQGPRFHGRHASSLRRHGRASAGSEPRGHRPRGVSRLPDAQTGPLRHVRQPDAAAVRRWRTRHAAAKSTVDDRPTLRRRRARVSVSAELLPAAILRSIARRKAQHGDARAVAHRPGLRRRSATHCRARCYAHGSSEAEFHNTARDAARRWLSLSPSPELYAFLDCDFRQLCQRHGGVYGARIRTPKLVPVPPNLPELRSIQVGSNPR